jgi:endonuclease/exonuclease/phosphatase family metal-dependent hydrolase
LSSGLLAAGLLALAALLSFTLLARPAEAAKGKGKRGVVVRTMTYNASLGSALSARFATSVDELCDKAGENVREVDATKPQVRMPAIAENILKQKPDLVGLQEADAVLTQTPPDNGPLLGGTDATTVRYDYLQLILDRLNKGKKRYTLVTVQDEFEFEIKANVDGVGSGCDGSETDARLITRNAILARVGAGVKTSRVRQESYRHQLSFELLGGVPYPVPRGWQSVDASVRGSKKLRFVHTHLEAFDNDPQQNTMLDTSTDPPTPTVVSNATVRAIQADELVSGPAKASIPVVLIGDINSNVPGVKPGDEKAFQRILEARFKRRSTQKPPSCCAHDISGGIGDFAHVVDFIMGKPGRTIRLTSSSVVGRTKVNGLFPSDHAGVFSALRVPRKLRRDR